MLDKEKLVSSDQIFNGRILKLRVDKVKIPQNGNISTREVVEHPGGVGVVAVRGDGKICFVRQYRRPFDEIVFEIPAGKRDGGEDPLITAKRELKEETGYEAENYEYLGGFYPSPGYCDEIIHIYLATNLTMGDNNLDENEFVELCYYSLEELEDMIKSNKIADAKTVIGILRAKMILCK